MRGTVVSGTGEAASFVALPWFRAAVRRIAGFDPYPGTLNVRVVLAERIPAAVVVPDVTRYGGELLEIVAAETLAVTS